MKALKILLTVLLSALALSAGVAAEALALARGTLLDPAFYGQNGREAYQIVGHTVVRKMAEAVLERAPAIVLRTQDKGQALQLAEQALPPERIAGMLEASAPDIARYLLYGSGIPVLKDSAAFTEGETAVVKGMLMDGVWDMLPDKPAFPAFMPFTPEWNFGHTNELPGQLWLVRQYAGVAGYAFWMAASAGTVFAGLLYLLWIRQRKAFCAIAGASLAFNGLLLAALAAAASFYVPQLAESVSKTYPASLVAGLLEQDWTALFRAVLRPFRDILAAWAAASLALAVAAFAAGIEREGPVWKLAAKRPGKTRLPAPAGKRREPRHAKAD